MSMSTRTTKPADSRTVVEVVSLPTPRRINLHNLGAVRREMNSVYRDMRAGKLATQDGARLVYVLGEVRKAIEAEIIEARITQLENANGITYQAPADST